MASQQLAPSLVPALDDDDTGFCELAERVLRGVAARFEPHEVIVVRIDRWFSRRWLGFACKVLGALGTRRREGSDVTLPPFVPARVRSQRRLAFEGGALREVDTGKPLHIRQWSPENERRRISRLLPERTLLAWISGGSARSGRGALMVYAWGPPEKLAFWYAGAARLDPTPPDQAAWAWVQTANVSRAELAAWASA